MAGSRPYLLGLAHSSVLGDVAKAQAGACENRCTHSHNAADAVVLHEVPVAAVADDRDDDWYDVPECRGAPDGWQG